MTFRRALAAPAVALTVALTMVPAAGLATAEASPRSVCRTVAAKTVLGVDYSRLRTKRSCVLTRDWSTAGESNLAANTIVVYADPRVTTGEVAQTTMHELTHQVDWRTTNAYRKQLYRYLGYRTNGSFWSVPSPAADWDGRDLRVWLSDPHERLAESVSRCQSGSARFEGMKLVPRAKCAAFLTVYRKAIRAVR